MERYIQLKESTETDKEQRIEALRIFNTIYTFLKKHLNQLERAIHNDNNRYDFYKNKAGGFSFLYSYLDKTYPNLGFQFNPKETNIKGGLGKTENYSMIVLNILLNVYDLTYLDTRFYGNKKLVIHEIIHFLDEQRYSKSYKGVNTAKLYKTKGLKSYVNTPEEFNAYFQEFVTDIENILTWSYLKTEEQKIKMRQSILNSYNSFKKFILSEDSTIYDNFEDKYRKKFDKRLYQFYKELKDKYK